MVKGLKCQTKGVTLYTL